MIKKGSYKKGATLVELSVVLAVLSIISTMVISFTIFLSERTKTTVKVNNLMQDVVVIKTVVESWASDLSKSNAQFGVEEDYSTLVAVDSYGEKHQLSKTENNLSATLLNGEILSHELSVVSELKFNVQSNGTQTLFICRVFYLADNVVQTFSFTINPFVGDLV